MRPLFVVPTAYGGGKGGGSVRRAIEVSRAELEERRGEILRRVGMSLDDLRDRAEAGALVGEEWEAWQQLRDIAFLLGDA